MQCVKHPKEETFVRCGKCEAPICPRCMVAAPVGMRCRDCAHQNSPVNRASGLQYLLATIAALVASVALGWMSSFIFWLGAAYGWLVAEATLRAGGRRRGIGMQIIAGLGALLGALLWHLPGFAAGHPQPLSSVATVLVQPFSLVAIGLSVFFAVAHVRYL
jgi:hypothetical protein